MEPSSSSTNFDSALPLANAHPPRTSSSSSTFEQGSSSLRVRRAGDGLRRGHSDGDVLTGGAGERAMALGDPAADQSWLDMIRQSSIAGQESAARAQLAASRAAVLDADRRRRMSEHLERARRRSSGTPSFPNLGAIRQGQNFGQPSSEESMFTPRGAGGSTSRGFIDRPLPPRPNLDTASTRESREIVLPQWQPDAEVSKCPICSVPFSLWYRRHHCRKCGRVVCAGCSPHRITIPRQFIVHPPDDVASSPNTTVNHGIEVVNLTEEDDTAGMAISTRERPRSSDYKVNPALGGGQEVRLCNPCVPDPNPLPHLPYGSSGLHSFPGPDLLSSRGAFLSGSPSRSGSNQPPNFVRRPSSSRPDYRPNNYSSFGAELSGAPGSSTTNRRHSHVPRPQVSPMSPPGYSSIYGSLPDQTAHQVSKQHPHNCVQVLIKRNKRHLASLLQNRPPHHQHRHHYSMDPSRYRPLPSFEMPRAQPALRPQLHEEDECPVCHEELPPKGRDGSETERERHIESCIASHTLSSGSRSTPPISSTATAGGTSVDMASSSQTSGARSIPISHHESLGSSSEQASGSFHQRRRPGGMVSYLATEKDCVGQEGETPECVICFEEFAVGVEMGRLECLCKFHKVGIADSLRSVCVFWNQS